MFQIMKKVILGVLAMSLVFVACKKDEDDSPTNTQLLTNGSSKTWRIDKVLVDGVDVTTSVGACSLDDNFVFNGDMTYEQNEGETKCDSTDSQVYDSGVWMFIENETKLVTVATSEDADTANIKLLSESSFNVEFTDDGQVQELRMVKK
jgi:hypothetical protein